MRPLFQCLCSLDHLLSRVTDFVFCPHCTYRCSGYRMNMNTVTNCESEKHKMNELTFVSYNLNFLHCLIQHRWSDWNTMLRDLKSIDSPQGKQYIHDIFLINNNIICLFIIKIFHLISCCIHLLLLTNESLSRQIEPMRFILLLYAADWYQYIADCVYLKLVCNCH